jgi:hypothetical protein
MFIFRECRHIKTNGIKCHSPAMRGSCFCYFHSRKRILAPKSRGEKGIEVPAIRNSRDLITALSRILQAIASGEVDSARGGKLLYAIQLAQQNISDLPDPTPNTPQPPQLKVRRTTARFTPPPDATPPASR